MDNYLPESFSYIPDIKISSKQVFGTKTDIRIPAFSKKSSLVPKIDKDYLNKCLNIDHKYFKFIKKKKIFLK